MSAVLSTSAGGVAASSSSSSSSSGADNAVKPGFVRITEGSVTMDYDEKEAVFYNKVQVFNRDISIQVIRLFAEQREKEKDDRHAKKQEKYLELCREQQAKEAALRGKPYDRSIDVAKVKLFERVPPDEKGGGSDAFKDPDNGKEIRAPFKPQSGIHVLDALAATGLRSVRYLKEIPQVRKVTINDLLPEATATARINCLKNGVPVLNNDNGAELLFGNGLSQSLPVSASASASGSKPEAAAHIHTGDAIAYMYANGTSADPFDVIDLDPYGTAAPFLDSAVRAVADGGLLCITCTDMAVLSGNFPEKCFSLYGTVGLRAKYLHEASLRTLLHSIDSAANRHKRYIVPWLSLSVDFYIRVFVRVFESPQDVKRSLLRRMLVHQSTQCESFYLQPMGATKLTKSGEGEIFTGASAQAPTVCEETDGPIRIGGPYWSAPIHDQNVVDELLRRVSFGDPSGEGNCPLLPFAVTTSQRIVAVLSTIAEELKDVPLYYCLSDLAANLHSRAPPREFMKNALNNAGYRFSQFHHEPSSVKTDAPPKVVWDIMRAYCKLHPPEGSKHKKQSNTAKAILARDITTPVNFDFDPNNRWVLSHQGVDDTPDNSSSVSYSLTHRHSPRNKATARGVPEASAVSVPSGAGPRYPMNPEKGWGPKRKAGRQMQTGDDAANDEEMETGGGGVRGKGEEERGRGKAFYLELNKDKGDLIRQQRAAARQAAEQRGEVPPSKKGRPSD